MALDFLNSPQSTPANTGGVGDLQNILGLIGQGAATANTFKGYQPTAAAGAQGQAMSNQNALLQSLLDPNSTIYKNVFAGQQQQLNNQTQQGLQSLMEMNRKAQLMGRGTFFNPERQDEAVSQYLGNQATNNAQTARSNALQQIIGAANGYGTAAGNYGKMIPQQQQAQNQNNSALPNGLNQIGQMLPMLMQAGSLFL